MLFLGLLESLLGAIKLSFKSQYLKTEVLVLLLLYDQPSTKRFDLLLRRVESISELKVGSGHLLDLLPVQNTSFNLLGRGHVSLVFGRLQGSSLGLLGSNLVSLDFGWLKKLFVCKFL